jgi:hypothetical protein
MMFVQPMEHCATRNIARLRRVVFRAGDGRLTSALRGPIWRNRAYRLSVGLAPGFPVRGAAGNSETGKLDTGRGLGENERMLVSGWENEIYDRRAFLDAAKRCPK